ncbi:SIR2 family protein [Promicromonospora sp. NFX87]|uniref:SIR2 family protein n=1 Tax=Promicromonospora sp. NFX87 TaxID=3402691 RepID=UPI003AFB634D
MAIPLSPSVMLATAMHAQPGVYAVLLGSGVSTGAGVPTGWGIVNELVRRVAAQEGPEAEADAVADAEAWWVGRFEEQLGYSSLLQKLAPTAPTRQAILESFLEPKAGEDVEPIRPSRAHEALAQLVKRGVVRVIVTTNFDRLMEQALHAAGVEPQVISRPSAAVGMRPLAHAPATVIKLHGDYKDTDSLNTDEELALYPEAWTALLQQILDEYGLLISGWSADWDTALVGEIEKAPGRRYPMYWDSRSSRGGNAQRLLAARHGFGIDAADADALFMGLLSNLETLDRLAEPPLTTAMAVARVKRFLPDPLKRIELHDLVMDRLDLIQQAAKSQGAYNPQIAEPQVAKSCLDAYRSATEPLLPLVAAGVFHDDGTHADLWVRLLQHALNVRRSPDGAYIDAVWALQHLPAQLILFTMAAAAQASGNQRLLWRLATEPTWRSPLGRREPEPAAAVLHPVYVVDPEIVNRLPRDEGESTNTWRYPGSHYLRMVLRPILESVVDEASVAQIMDDTEYRLGLAQWLRGARHPYAGEFMLDERWLDDEPPMVEAQLLEELKHASTAEPWASVLGPAWNEPLIKYRTEVAKQWRWP